MSRARAPKQTPPLGPHGVAGATSARGLLLTLLGEFVLPGDGATWTSATIEALGRVGVEQKATRQALMRTAAGGWLVAEKVGRRTRWRLTDSACRLLTDGARRIYSFASPASDWDGRWLVVCARIPTTDRHTRHIVRTRLSWAGFGSLAPGVWISPHPAREAEAMQVLHAAGIATDAHVFVATRSGLGDVRGMVAAAWNLAAIEERYAQFLVDFRSRTSADLLARDLELVHAWRQFPAIDPLLPRRLLPADWNGVSAANLFADLHQRWLPGARSQWHALNQAG